MKSQRLKSLDIVRGITVAGMILVNNGYSGSFEMLQHASWNGLSLSDFVFPFFLFIMGVSIFLSLSKNRFEFTGKILGKILKRSLLLLLIGIGINWFDMLVWGNGLNFAELRFWAVLQRIALCYLLVALFAVTRRHKFTIPLTILLLIAYSIILLLGNGYSEESAANILYKVDEWMLGDPHLYHYSPVDPEGLLSTICALVNTLLGFYCGMKIKANSELNYKIISTFTLGTILIIIAFILNFFLPYNKHIWSPSFALITSGSCSLLLALVMWLVDSRQSAPTPSLSSSQKSGSILSDIFMVFGSNALLLYITSELMAIIFGRIGLSQLLYETLISLLPVPQLASLAYALFYVLMNYLIGYPLWRHRIYIKL